MGPGLRGFFRPRPQGPPPSLPGSPPLGAPRCSTRLRHLGPGAVDAAAPCPGAGLRGPLRLQPAEGVGHVARHRRRRRLRLTGGGELGVWEFGFGPRERFSQRLKGLARVG